MEHENALRFNLRECTFQNFLGYTPILACTSLVKMPDRLRKGCFSPDNGHNTPLTASLFLSTIVVIILPTGSGDLLIVVWLLQTLVGVAGVDVT